MAKFSFVDQSGSRQEIDVDVTDYAAAGEQGISLSEHLAQKYPASTEHGTTFEQCMASAGLFMTADNEYGIRPPTMKSVLSGNVELSASAITRGDGTGTSTPGGRLLFPEVILQTIRSELDTNYDDFLGGFNSMVAQTQSVTSPKVDQPIVDVTAPKGSSSQEIAQLAEPAAMVTITTSDKVLKIPTKSIGLTISDEALAAATLDLVGLTMTAQARQERVRVVEEHLSAMINGDADRGEAALSGAQVVADTTLDPSNTTAGVLTHKAWVKYLRSNYRKMRINWVMCDIDAALAIEGRINRPSAAANWPGTAPQIVNADFTVDNLSIAAPRVLLVDNGVVPANTVVGIDSRYAIRRIVNVSASYSAIESYVMRRATSFRVDFGEIAHKLYNDAWYKMTF